MIRGRCMVRGNFWSGIVYGRGGREAVDGSGMRMLGGYR